MLFLIAMYTTLAKPIPYQDLRWRAIHDTVMGGVSSGTIDQTTEGLLFQGFLSLENNGGFTSTRARVTDSLSQQTQGIRIRIIGDGRTYLATLRTDSNPMIYYRQAFPTTAGVETEIDLPILNFGPHAYGRFLPQVPPLTLQTQPIESIGFMLADKKQGAFSLRILSIEAYGNIAASPTLSSAQKQSLLTAIETGVPLYNRGRTDLCAETYRDALVALQQSTSAPWFDKLLSHTKNTHDMQAWWYRHMINHLLQNQIN